MRRRMKNAILILLILTLSASTALLAYIHFLAPGDGAPVGEWTAQLGMRERAAVTAFHWLQDIEAVSVSLEDMEAYMPELTIRIELTLEESVRPEGIFHCRVLPESYDACYRAAYEAFAEAFRELLAERLHMAGYTGGTDGEALEDLVTEAFGMSTVSYLMAYGPALLPSLEDLQARYDGSGVYEAAEGILTRRFEAGQPVAIREERYIWEGSKLILLEEINSDSAGSFFEHYPIIYTFVQPQSQ